MTLNLNPPKGTADRKPEEFRVRKYIFDTWRKVCESFAYDEYLGPLVEDAAIWEAKSGEDVGGTELTKITNRNGEISDLALRPEMTPTVTRMIAKYQREYTKPIRRFSIANFYRNERPQRGRNREFWQCNVDLFGDASINAEIEILQIACEMMLAFEGVTRDDFTLRINHRELVNDFLGKVLGLEDNTIPGIIRIMDKYNKLSTSDFLDGLIQRGCTKEQADNIYSFMNVSSTEELGNSFPGLKDHKGVIVIEQINTTMVNLGYGEVVCFDLSLMRGFDYYNGLVFEIFAEDEENNRALFGGGRYNGLADIFGVKESIPAVGFAPGDETMKLFLETKKEFLEKEFRQERYYVPLLEEGKEELVMKKAQELRAEGKKVEVGLKLQTEKKAYEVATKKGIERERVVIV